MPTIVTDFPAEVAPTTISLLDVLAVLPDTINYPLNVWLESTFAKYGQHIGTIIFTGQMDTEPSPEQMQYFNGLVTSLNVDGTLYNDYKNANLCGLQIYNNGVLVRDRTTGALTGDISALSLPPILTAAYIRSKLMAQTTVPFTDFSIWFTGSCVDPAKGWSGKDTDIMLLNADGSVLEDAPDRTTKATVRRYFTDLIGWSVDVGLAPMTEREPVYMCKVYEGGNLCLV